MKSMCKCNIKINEGGIGARGFGPFFPQFFGVLDFEARFCGFLRHHGLRLLVLIVGGLQFADVIFGFLVALKLILCMQL